MNNIRNKILRKTLLTVIVSLLICIFISYAAIDNIRNNATLTIHESSNIAAQHSSEALIEQAKIQTIEYTKSCAKTIEYKMQSIISAVKIVDDEITNIYEAPDEYIPHPYEHPKNSPADTLCMQWVLPEGLEMDEHIEKETYLLGNIENLLDGTLKMYKNILSIYYTSDSGINIGYDDTAQTKPEYFDGRNSEWFMSVKETKNLYISNAYNDSFGRGRMITIAIPCIGSDGSFYGACGVDILIDDLSEIISNVNAGEDSYAILASPDEIICADTLNENNSNDFSLFLGIDSESILKKMYAERNGIIDTVIENEDVYCVYSPVGISDWIMIMVISKSKITEPSVELDNSIHNLAETSSAAQNKQVMKIIILWIAMIITVILLSVIVTGRLAKNISNPIVTLCKAVEKVGTGNLEYDCKIKTGDEIERLSDSFGDMTESLKEYIESYAKVTAEKERISTELNVAKQIQEDMLPRIFPAFPERTEFDVYASMNPAKEVGGDFYDFFLIDKNHLALIIADVSGKGVPAALFMVISKTLLKNQALMKKEPKDILIEVNNQLCENNDAQMFVTVWLGIYEISTGKLIAANAGHEYPAIRRSDGNFELYKDKHGFVLAGMENVKYRQYELQMGAGDTLFVYTDGVAEATNSNNQLFGTDRMINALNKEPDSNPQRLICNISEDINKFVGKADQFDDITMLAIKINEIKGEQV